MAALTSSFTALSTPAYTISTTQLVTTTGTVSPAVAGRPVQIQKASDGAVVATATTAADGSFSVTYPVMVVTNFKAVAPSYAAGGNTYSAVTSATFQVRSLRLWDQFTYASWEEMEATGRWKLRGTEYGTGKRESSKADARAVELRDGKLLLKVVPDPDNPGKHLVGHVSAGVFDFVNGHFEARIKFNRFKGAHGSLWHQGGYGPGQAEFDIVEFFGERYPGGDVNTQKVQHTVHVGDGAGGTIQYPRFTWTENGTGTPLTTNFAVGNNDTWWSEYHVFHGYWGASGYQVYIDDKSVGKIDVPPATEPGEVILSLLSNDGSERDTLLSYIKGGTARYSDYIMCVDWIRVWR